MAESIETKLVVRHFPDRVKPCLCLEQGNKSLILATFQKKDFVQYYEDFLGGNCIVSTMKNIFID